MANVWYDKALTAIGKKQIDLTTDPIIFLAVAVGYAFSQSDQYVSDIGGGNIVGRTGTLTSPTMGAVSEGMFDADDSVFPLLAGAAVTQLIMAHNTGTDATSHLLLQADGTKVGGLPFTPTGVDVPLIFSAAGIAKL